MTVKISYFFFLLKVLDLIETIFFILRKKNQQVTFLHIYHHAGVVTIGYFYFKLYSGGGAAAVFGVLNGFIHFIMYGYYFLTSYKSELKTSIWWKKYITLAQLIQFTIFAVYCFAALFKECSNTKVFVWIALVQSIGMFALFYDFYYKAYIKKRN